MHRLSKFQKVRVMHEDKDGKYRWHNGVVQHVGERITVKVGTEVYSYATADIQPV